MPGEHEREKLEAVVIATKMDEVHGACITTKDVMDLHDAVRINKRAIFKPWHWREGTLKLVRSYGCIPRISLWT